MLVVLQSYSNLKNDTMSDKRRVGGRGSEHIH